jgi:transposase
MEVIHPRCAGVDVSKKDAKVCVRVQGRGRRGTSMTVTTWGSTTAEILALGEHLLAQQVSCVVIESTSDYWKPFYCLLEGQLPVMLVNTKALEDAGIKLSAVASNIVGVSGRAMLEALIAGERDPVVLADLAKRGMRQKIPALTEALRGRFTEHHAFMVRLYLDRIDAHSADIARLDGRIEAAIAPFRFARELLMSIPGWSQVVADVFIAETGADMSVFPTAEHLASWAGVVPGCDESAGRVKSGSTRPGNRHLKAALGVAALSAARTKDT